MQKPGVTTTRNSITIRRVDYKTDSGLYQCLAENKDGGVLSNEINVRVRGSYFLNVILLCQGSGYVGQEEACLPCVVDSTVKNYRISTLVYTG